MKIPLSRLLLLFISVVFTITDVSAQFNNYESKFTRKLAIKTDLISPILTRLPSFNLLGEYKIRPNVAIHAGYGFRLNGMYARRPFGEDLQYNKVIFGGHFAFKHKPLRIFNLMRFVQIMGFNRFGNIRPFRNGKIHRLLGMRISYIPMEYRKLNSWLIRDGDQFDFTESLVSVKKINIEVTIGHRYFENENLYLDGFFSFGFARNYIKHQTTGETPVTFLRSETIITFYPPIDREVGINHRFLLNIGLEIGIGISKKYHTHTAELLR